MRFTGRRNSSKVEEYEHERQVQLTSVAGADPEPLKMERE